MPGRAAGHARGGHARRRARGRGAGRAGPAPGDPQRPDHAGGIRGAGGWGGPVRPPRARGDRGHRPLNGAGLARWLGARGVTVVEVDRPDRRARRRHGTSDSVDAEAAARAVQAGTAAAQPRVSTSAMAMLRALRVARQAAVTARAQAANHFHALVVTAPDGRRAQLRPRTLARLVTRAAAFRQPAADHARGGDQAGPQAPGPALPAPVRRGRGRGHPRAPPADGESRRGAGVETAGRRQRRAGRPHGEAARRGAGPDSAGDVAGAPPGGVAGCDGAEFGARGDRLEDEHRRRDRARGTGRPNRRCRRRRAGRPERPGARRSGISLIPGPPRRAMLRGTVGRGSGPAPRPGARVRSRESRVTARRRRM